MVTAQTRTKIYSVSEVNSLIKEVIESGLPASMTVRGEITDWKLHHSGHGYFSLKDQDSVLPCAIWKTNLAKVRFEPQNGLSVLASGYIDVYVPQGRYKFVVEQFTPAGVGALQLAFEQMVKKLEAEGLFADAHKKAIPPFPARIGILTSESGAAIHDITKSIWDRWPCARLFLYPVPVQGPGAAAEIAAAIRDANQRNKVLKLDVLIVGRGGGSLEDLWAFNEEVLARAIYNSQIPIISAVGHEVDVTVADLVADARASTPTKAGVVAVPDVHEVLRDLANTAGSLRRQARARLELSSETLHTILASGVFRDPLLPVRNREQHVDELGMRLHASVKDSLAGARDLLRRYYEQMPRIEPHRLLARSMVLVSELRAKLLGAVAATAHRGQVQLAAQENRLAGLNPRSVLRRGYTITAIKTTGQVIRSPDAVQIGDEIVTELAEQNLIESRVTQKRKRTDPTSHLSTPE